MMQVEIRVNASRVRSFIVHNRGLRDGETDPISGIHHYEWECDDQSRGSLDHARSDGFEELTLKVLEDHRKYRRRSRSRP